MTESRDHIIAVGIRNAIAVMTDLRRDRNSVPPLQETELRRLVSDGRHSAELLLGFVNLCTSLLEQLEVVGIDPDQLLQAYALRLAGEHGP